MNKLAATHPRWGYRRVYVLLREAGGQVNRKRVERLWRLEGHRVPLRRVKASGQKALGREDNSIWMRPAASANHIWAYDLMSTRTRRGGLVRILNVVDEFTRVALGSLVAGSIGAQHVVDFLAPQGAGSVTLLAARSGVTDPASKKRVDSTRGGRRLRRGSTSAGRVWTADGRRLSAGEAAASERSV